MRRILSLFVVLAFSLCSFGAVLADTQVSVVPEGVVITVDSPAVEILVDDPDAELFYNAADEYYITNGTTVTIRISLPDTAILEKCWVQCAFDWWEPHYMADLAYEDGCYVFTSEIDSIDTTGSNFSDFQFYFNQDYNPYPGGHYPDVIINLYATEADADAFCADFTNVTWTYAAEPGPLMGDVDGDEAVTTADALLIQRYVLGVITLEDAQLALADVNGDGSIDFTDALIVLRLSLT